ncbi:hypothetical protein ACK1CN_01415 [Vibrio coralliilyticus]|uniref:hypothetical protein n=1 Tax=Vibrio coralliilyticus TaxID=190893 RepID=UPI003916FA38
MDNLIYIGIVIAAILGGGFIAWFFGNLFEAIAIIVVHRSKLKSFKSDFENAVIHSQVDWEGMKRIAQTRGLKPSQLYWTLEEYIRDIKTGQNEKLSGYLDLIESYITAYKHDEPFQSLPSDIRIHLERVRDKLGSAELLDPLTSQIKDLLAIHSEENKRAKFYSIGGFITGLMGVALAIVFYFLPLNTGVDVPALTAASEQVVDK